MNRFSETTRDFQGNSRHGQALVEFLVLLPVILLLFLATTEIAKLFAISGKTEVAARYLALRHFRGEPFAQGHDFQVDLVDTDAAEEVNELFFKGTLDDPYNPDHPDDLVVGDIDYLKFTPKEGPLDPDGNFYYHTPTPTEGSLFWTIMSAYFDPSNALFPIRAHRVTFTYDLPFFPFKTIEDAPAYWAQNTDLGGPYQANGDFVMVSDSFNGDTALFLQRLETAGLIINTPATAVSAAIGILVFLLLFL